MKNNSTKNYFLHCVQPERDIQDLEFVHIDRFLKKKSKNKNVNSVFIGDLLEYFDYDDASIVISDILNKLEPGTTLIIQGIDSKSICQSFGSDELLPPIFNMLIYGKGKKSIFTFPTIKYIVESKENLEVSKIKFLDSIHYYIECIKK